MQIIECPKCMIPTLTDGVFVLETLYTDEDPHVPTLEEMRKTIEEVK